jgi:glycogen operon protein
MIKFRKYHKVITRSMKQAWCGFPDVSFHSCKSWNGEYDNDTRVIGVMYAGRTLDDKKEDIVYIGIFPYILSNPITTSFHLEIRPIPPYQLNKHHY